MAGQGNTPTPVGGIPEQTVAVGSDVSLLVSGYFEDPNGDPLTYGATTNDPDIATASASGDTVTITGVATGQTALTVTANDPDNHEGILSTIVAVVAPGQGPVTAAPVPDRSVAVGQALSISVADHFQDPDGGGLTFTASSSNPDIVAATASGSDVTLTGVAEGRATVTVTASDAGGLSVAQSISVTVEPGERAPATVGNHPGLSIEAAGVDFFDAASYFRATPKATPSPTRQAHRTRPSRPPPPGAASSPCAASRPAAPP